MEVIAAAEALTVGYFPVVELKQALRKTLLYRCRRICGRWCLVGVESYEGGLLRRRFPLRVGRFRSCLCGYLLSAAGQPAQHRMNSAL